MGSVPGRKKSPYKDLEHTFPCGKQPTALCDQSGGREQARDVMVLMVMVFWGLMKELRLHAAGKGTHEVIRQ